MRGQSCPSFSVPSLPANNSSDEHAGGGPNTSKRFEYRKQTTVSRAFFGRHFLMPREQREDFFSGKINRINTLGLLDRSNRRFSV
jgi:hypothetical protein